MTFRNHRFSRLELLVGREGLERFRTKHVMVVGVGGVGSFAAEALARAAVGHISLVDHDEVCVTNVNRQLHAFTDTVGKKKVPLVAERIKRINPIAQSYAILEHHHPLKGDHIFEVAEKLAGKPVDAVLDCIDTVVPKADLLRRCVEKGIYAVSSMGSASRLDPSKIRAGDISESKVDPLAKQVRLKLREHGVESGVRVVYSVEKPLDPSKVIPGSEWQCICPNIEKEFGACVHKRLMLGTISYLPPMFGMWLVSELTRHWLADVDLEARQAPHALPTYAELEREVMTRLGRQD